MRSSRENHFIMKNLFSLIVVTAVLLFASCSKEALLEPEFVAPASIEKFEKKGKFQPEAIAISEASSFENTIEIPVTTVSSSISGSELMVDFIGNHDFTESNLETTQTLDFTDTHSNTVTLTFGVNSYTGTDGALDVTFAIGGNSLSGLVLVSSQQIIIEDTIMD